MVYVCMMYVSSLHVFSAVFVRCYILLALDLMTVFADVRDDNARHL